MYLSLSLILKPFHPWARSDGHTQGREAVPRVRLTACPPSCTQHTLPPTHHLLVAATKSWEKGTRPWSDKGIRMEQSAAPLGSFSIVTALLWWHTHTHSCFMPTSKSGPFLTVTFCLPATHRQTQTLKNGSTLPRSGEVSCFAQWSVKPLTRRMNEWSNDRFQCNKNGLKIHVWFVASGDVQLGQKVILTRLSTTVILQIHIFLFFRGLNHFFTAVWSLHLLIFLIPPSDHMFVNDRLIGEMRRGYHEVLTQYMVESYATRCWTIFRTVSNVPSDLAANHLVPIKCPDVTGWLSTTWINSIICCHLEPHTRGVVILWMEDKSQVHYWDCWKAVLQSCTITLVIKLSWNRSTDTIGGSAGIYHFFTDWQNKFLHYRIN